MDNSNDDLNFQARRMAKFLYLLDIYFEILKGRMKNSRSRYWLGILLELIYSYFYSLMDDRDDSVNVFRIWKIQFPNHKKEIERVEKEVQPYKRLFKDFRNKVGFHGGITQKDYNDGMKIFKELDGNKTMEIILKVRNLSSHLITLENEEALRILNYNVCIVCNDNKK